MAMPVGDGLVGSCGDDGDCRLNWLKSQVDSKVGSGGRANAIEGGRGRGGGVMFIYSSLMSSI